MGALVQSRNCATVILHDGRERASKNSGSISKVKCCGECVKGKHSTCESVRCPCICREAISPQAFIKHHTREKLEERWQRKYAAYVKELTREAERATQIETLKAMAAGAGGD